MSFVLGTLFGVFLVFGYLVWRMLRDDEWDDSNVNNAVRLIGHVAIHPADFGKMYYITDTQRYWLTSAASPDRELRRPFWYIDKDEFESVVNTRP